jgi:muramoyltetrapeptide carboxypeptidase
VRIIAPSGPVPTQPFDSGLRVLSRTLDVDVVLAANIHQRSGYFAGDDRQRLWELREAIADPEAAAILCARGGYGTTRLLGSIDPEPLTDHPKILVGFSDVTALLCWAHTRAGLTSIHGPVVTQLSTLGPDDVDRLETMLLGECPAALEADQGTVVVGGKVEGPLVVGNLEVMRSLIGTQYLPPLDGAILGLEEVGERPYRIDRALTHMLESGVLRGIRAVIVGQLVECGEPDEGHEDSPSAHDVIVERLQRLGVPIVTGFSFGHRPASNTALPFGTFVQLDADSCTLRFPEPAAIRDVA